MSGDVQVRFCESLRVRFPRATRLLIFAKTKRQLSRCRRRMMDVLHERRLSLSRKKSRMGCISGGFHFLGINYLPTRTEGNTNISHINDVAITTTNNVYNLNENGGVVRQILSIKGVSRYAWSLIREPCVKRESKLNIW